NNGRAGFLAWIHRRAKRRALKPDVGSMGGIGRDLVLGRLAVIRIAEIHRVVGAPAGPVCGVRSTGEFVRKHAVGGALEHGNFNAAGIGVAGIAERDVFVNRIGQANFFDEWANKRIPAMVVVPTTSTARQWVGAGPGARWFVSPPKHGAWRKLL